MRILKVTYRATFRQPVGKLNPMGLTMQAPISVEVYQAKADKWGARRPDTSYLFEEIPSGSSAVGMQGNVQSCFENQLTEWERYGDGGRKLEDYEISTRSNGHVYLLEPEDFTHMPNLTSPHPDKKKGYGACAGTFRHDQFVSLHMNIPPTCRECLKNWEAR